jgi:hypothetical protein
MPKYIILFCCLLLIPGCNKKSPYTEEIKRALDSKTTASLTQNPLTKSEMAKKQKEDMVKALASLKEQFLYPDNGLTSEVIKHGKLEPISGGYKMVVAWKQYEQGKIQGVFISTATFNYSLKATELYLETGRNLDSIY